MQNVVNKYVRVSDLSSYLLCPRLAYFRTRKREASPSFDVMRSAAFKEISCSLASVLTADDPAATLESSISDACADAEIIYGLPADRIRDEALRCAGDIVAGLRSESSRMGRDRLLALLCPHAGKRAFYSDRLRISGIVDRVAVLDEKRVPVIVCVSRPPEHGVYAADRLKLAAYAMLMAEKYGEEIGRGAAEYFCGWRIREIEIRRDDRMAVLSARNRVLQMGSAMPEARRGAWCVHCERAGSCSVKVSFMDSLFRPVLSNNSDLSRNGTNK